ncbi:unnamed protein product [Arabidopsis lyrata]|nr:unnamed protein product [Arabidopsis lyrata]CAH8260686.1 unnamed protein product [Arabidopsis lyrata]
MKREDLMAVPVKLPYELEEDILSRLPPLSLARFRSVCKLWNDLFNENRFINDHFGRARPQFILLDNSNIYSIEIIDLDGIDPTIELRELASSGIPYRELDLDHTTITTCDGFLFCNFFVSAKGTALWNPWLRQVKWIEYEDKEFYVFGLGYDNTIPKKYYRIFGYFVRHRQVQRDYHQRVAIYECVSQAFKYIDTPDEDWPIKQATRGNVSLNGNLYWVACNPNTHEYYIQSFDFSRDIVKAFCLTPCRKNRSRDVLFLSVFKGDGFSLLKQCYVTRSVEIWVTKKKIDTSNNGGEDIVWINLMILPTTNLPSLINKFYGISYFIYDKTTLIMCCCDDENRATCIYIVRGDLFKKIQINSGVFQCCHCVYAPNLIPLL